VLTVTVVTYLLNRDRDRRINAPVVGDVSVHRSVDRSSSTLRLLTSQLVPAQSHAVGPPTSPGPADSAVVQPVSDWSTALNNYQSPL